MGNRSVKIEVDKSQKAPKISTNVRNSKFKDTPKPKKVAC